MFIGAHLLKSRELIVKFISLIKIEGLRQTFKTIKSKASLNGKNVG